MQGCVEEPVGPGNLLFPIPPGPGSFPFTSEMARHILAGPVNHTQNEHYANHFAISPASIHKTRTTGNSAHAFLPTELPPRISSACSRYNPASRDSRVRHEQCVTISLEISRAARCHGKDETMVGLGSGAD